jgi:pimeloyl-ACP methyl ester carboxylesterase
MAKLSRATRETLKTIAVLLVILLIVIMYVIYPLNRTKAMMGRQDSKEYKLASLPPNDLSAFISAGLSIDSFRVEADGLTRLACVKINPRIDSGSQVRGMVVMIHREHEDRTSLIDQAKALSDSGFEVVLYDQRASGLTTDVYHGDGIIESTDLESLIEHLAIHQQLRLPLTVVGYGLGADAAIFAAADEKRIGKIIGIDPYLTSDRMLRLVKKQSNVLWFPFSDNILWWWYKIRSGYALTYRDVGNISKVSCPTVLIFSPERINDPEVKKIEELSSKELLVVKSVNDFNLVSQILTGNK